MISQIFQCLVALTLCITPSIGVTQDAMTPSRLAEEIQTVIDQAELGRFWGAAVVRVGDQTIISRGYGFESQDLHPITPQASLFDVGSISKSITAATILKLIEQEKLTLSTTLDELFGDAAGNLSSVTIEQLLRHQSGLAHAQGMFSDRAAFESPDSLIAAAGQIKLGPKEFAYSNPGYHVLAAIIEHLGVGSFEETTHKLTFKPAKISTVGFVGEGAVTNARPTARIMQDRYGTTSQGSIFDYPWNWAQRGATGVVMTAQATADWFEAIEKGDWLTDTSREAMLTPNANGYGLGLYIDTNDDGLVSRIWHGGETGGYKSHAARYPLAFDGQGATVVLLTQSTIDLRSITNKLHKLIAPSVSKPVFAGVYLSSLPEPEDQSVYTIDQGLNWKGMTQYIGSNGSEQITDNRPTLILEDRTSRMWRLILRMDDAIAQSLIEELTFISTMIANDPQGGASPWSKGTTLIINMQDLPRTEHNSFMIDDGAILSVRTSADHHAVLVVSTPNNDHELAQIKMGGSEVRQLQSQLRAALR